MATTIRLKSSVVKDKVPAAGDIQIGEVCVGAHPDSPMLLFKDSSNNIIKIEPADAEGILWEAQEVGDDTYISPKETTSVLYLPDGPDKYWVFRPYEDSSSGTATPEVRITGDAHVEARTFEAAEGRSSDWDSVGGASFEASNYGETTFAASPMGDVDIRRNLVVGNIGTSGARTPGHIQGISRNDEDATSIGFSLKFGETTPFSVDYTGEVTAGKFVGDGSGLTNLPVAAGLWKQEGDAVTPIAAGADLKIEGDISSNQKINAGGPAYTDYAFYGASNTTDVDKPTFRAYNAASGGLVWGAFNAAGSSLTTEISESGNITAAGNVKIGDYSATTNDVDGVQVFNSGNIYLQQSGTGATNLEPFRIYYGTTVKASFTNQGNLDTKGDITAAGTGHFKGDVAVGEATTTFLDKAAVIAALTPEQRTLFASAIAAWNARPEPYAADDPSTLPADLPLREAIVRATTLGKINLNGDTGSIDADGAIKSDSTFLSYRDDPDTTFLTGYLNDAIKLTLNGDGGINAASNVLVGEPGSVSSSKPGGYIYSNRWISDDQVGSAALNAQAANGNLGSFVAIDRSSGSGVQTAVIYPDGTITAKTFDLDSLEFLPA